MLEGLIRQPLQYIIFEPITKLLSRAHFISPTKLTVLSGILGLIIIPALYFNHPYTAIILLLVSGLFDILDGTLARQTNKQSQRGAALDIFMDRIVECSVVFGLVLISPATRAIPVTLMLISMILCLVAFTTAAIFIHEKTHKSFFYSTGIMERAEAFIFFILMILLPEYFNILAYIFSALVTITATQHLYKLSKISLLK